MKGDIYAFLRKTTRLPRPNELWGDKVRNSWNAGTFYLYFKLCIGELMSHVGLFLMLFSNIITVLTYLAVKEVNVSWVGIGAFVLIILTTMFGIGHLLVIFGVTKKQTTLGNSQNEELMEIFRTVKNIENKLK